MTKTQYYFQDPAFNIYGISNYDVNHLVSSIIDFYSLGTYVPLTEIDDEKITLIFNKKNYEKIMTKVRKIDLHYKNNKLEKMFTLLEELVTDYPHDADVLYFDAYMLSQNGNSLQAIERLHHVLHQTPNHIASLLLLAHLYSTIYNDNDKAYAYASQALILEPKHYKGHTVTGTLYEKINQIDKAKYHFHESIKINPYLGIPYYYLAKLYNNEENHYQVFLHALSALKYLNEEGEEWQEAFQMYQNAYTLLKTTHFIEEYVLQYKQLLTNTLGIPIQLEAMDKVSKMCKLELANNIHPSYHLIQYDKNFPHRWCMIMRELVYIELLHHARITNNQYTLEIQNVHKQAYTALLKSTTHPDLSSEEIDNKPQPTLEDIQEHVNKKIVDAIIDDIIYYQHPHLRPIHFYYINTMLAYATSYIDLTIQHAHPILLSIYKKMAYVKAMQIEEFYIYNHKNWVKKISNKDIGHAGNMYKAIKTNMKHSANLLQTTQDWLKFLKIDSYIELVPNDTNKRMGIDQLLLNIKNNAFVITEMDEKLFDEENGKVE